MITICPQCNGQKDKRAQLCRSCKNGSVSTEKTCTSCKRVLPLSAFRIRTRKQPRPRSQCKECESAQQSRRLANADRAVVNERKRQWYRKNPASVKRTALRSYCRKVGIAETSIPAILKQYNETDSCAICQRPTSETGTLHLDHCHESNRFRGFLCSNCNTGLGQFKDRPNLLRKAIDYLETFAATSSETGQD